jgi:hypothetical protein
MEAKEYWKSRFGEYPQTDADRLAVAMMQEYRYYLEHQEAIKNK